MYFCRFISIGQYVDRKVGERVGDGIRKGSRARFQTQDAQSTIALMSELGALTHAPYI